MQRRRRPKNEPRNIFDKGSGAKSPRPSKPSSRAETPPKKPSQRPSVKPLVPISKPVKKTPPPSPVKSSEEAIPEDKEEISEVETLVEEQLLGTPKRKGRGLQSISSNSELDEVSSEEPRASSRAMEIIEATKVRAAATMETERKKLVTKSAPAPPVKRPPRRRKKPSYQPANREKRLDRSRHMEYKYEMRGLLAEINVAEEFRSSLLGSIWAKGERQTSQEAREYIDEKKDEGMINDEQAERLLTIVNNYTIRR